MATAKDTAMGNGYSNRYSNGHWIQQGTAMAMVDHVSDYTTHADCFGQIKYPTIADLCHKNVLLLVSTKPGLAVVPDQHTVTQE